MHVPTHMQITASLMAGYRMQDGSLIEVDASGDYRITNAYGLVIVETADTYPGDGYGLRFGVPPEDYGEILDDLAAFLLYYAPEPEHDNPFGTGTNDLSSLVEWTLTHEDELSTLANYREDKRLGNRDWDRGYGFGADANYDVYYVNGESEAFAQGFLDGRQVLYSRVEDDDGNVRNPEGLAILVQPLPTWEAIRAIEQYEEE